MTKTNQSCFKLKRSSMSSVKYLMISMINMHKFGDMSKKKIIFEIVVPISVVYVAIYCCNCDME